MLEEQDAVASIYNLSTLKSRQGAETGELPRSLGDS